MKGRLSASVDEHLLAAAEEVVRQGFAPSMSALVEEALKHQIAQSKRVAAMEEYLARLDEDFGAIDADDADDAATAVRRWRAGAVVVRPPDTGVADRA